MPLSLLWDLDGKAMGKPWDAKELGKDWFKEQDRWFEQVFRTLAEDTGNSILIPKIKTGILVPEVRAQSLLKLRKEYWSENSD